MELYQQLLADEGFKYKVDETASAYRTDITTTADPTNVTSLESIAAFRTHNYRNLAIHGRFSDASATTSIWVLRCRLDSDTSSYVVMSKEGYSFTADANINDGGQYLSDEVYFDVGGAAFAKIICSGTSAGTLDLWVRSF